MTTSMIGTILAYAIGLVIVYIIAKVLVIPAKVVWKLIVNALIGGITLLIVNFLGSYIGISIDITIVTALIAGIFGLPGVILLIILKMFL